jgi:hypothetical protein
MAAGPLTCERESLEFAVWIIVIVGLLIPVTLFCCLWNNGGGESDLEGGS